MSEGCPKREYTITFGHQLPEDKFLANYPIFITNNIEIAAKMFCILKTAILELIRWNGNDEREFKVHIFDEPYNEVKNPEDIPKTVNFVNMTQIPLPKYLKEALDNKFNSIMWLHQNEILRNN